MIVIDVLDDPDRENHHIVLVDFDGNIRFAEDTQNLEDVRDVNTTVDFVINNHIKTGNIYRGVYHKKIEGSGDCLEEIIDWEQKLLK
jgi:hypothetical protein